MSEGYIGEIDRLLIEAAVHAVMKGKEYIDRKLLDEINWTAPSDRRREPRAIR
jgi:hypothetical protein